jgi:hypothetical protein
VRYFSNEFELRRGGKVRVFNNPNLELRLFIDELHLKLKTIFPHLKSPNRLLQSQQDIDCYKRYRYVLLLDIKKALMSGNVLLICFFLSLFYPRFISLVPLVIKIYFSSVINNQKQIVQNRKNVFKAGFKTSEQILSIIFDIPLKVFNIYGESRLYVDDVILFSQSKSWLTIHYILLKCYFYVLGFRFHKIERYDLLQKPAKCGQRLGLFFGFNSDGQLAVKVRAKTLRKYLSRIKRSIHGVSSEIGIPRVGKFLFGMIEPPTYPLYATFNHSIWTDAIQRRQFFAHCVGVLKKRYPELRKYSKEEMCNLLWGNSYNKLPVLEEDLWTGTIGSSSASIYPSLSLEKL